MGLIKDIKLIKKQVEKITDQTILKSNKYDFIKENLEKIPIRIKKINNFFDEYGKYGIKIEYEIPPVKLIFDDNNDVMKNDIFYAINSLQLLSIEDERKLIEILEKIKNMNNQI